MSIGTTESFKFPRQAIAVETLPTTPEDGGYWYALGRETATQLDVGKRMITKIEVLDDVPGLHCNLWWVLVWSEDQLVAEFPYLSVVHIKYA